MRPFGSPYQLEQRRTEAIALLEKGFAPVDVAHTLKVDRRSVRRWKARFRKNGAQGISAKTTPGRPPRLTKSRKSTLERLLLKGAEWCGYPTNLWTCPRIARLIDRKFGIHYHVDHIGRLLHSMGWSPQRPERRAKERDEKAITSWVKTQWPRFKKKPAN